MNAHKTQLTNARINCALKESSRDSPLSKILKLTILASNSSSSSTKVTPDQRGLLKACNGAECKELRKTILQMVNAQELEVQRQRLRLEAETATRGAQQHTLKN
uniref:Uncharacterized protein n=1 Tax=Solanum tuberosum TaxID=4113 RepID=M1DL12_SOLTU